MTTIYSAHLTILYSLHRFLLWQHGDHAKKEAVCIEISVFFFSHSFMIRYGAPWVDTRNAPDVVDFSTAPKSNSFCDRKLSIKSNNLRIYFSDPPLVY